MKKILLCLFSVISLCASAQIFELKHNNVILQDGDVIEIKTGEMIAEEWKMKCYFSVTNISPREYSMYMDKEVITEATNSTNTMCWDQCMEPTDLTAECANLSSGETSNTPYGEVITNALGEAVAGTTTVKYTFSTSKMDATIVAVTVNYTFDPNNPSGVNSAEENKLSIRPVDGVIEIITPESKTIAIYDIAGRTVKVAAINSGINYINDLPRGIYIIEKQKIIL